MAFGHQQKIAGNVQVEVLHAAHFGQVLVGDLRDVDGADVNLLAADQVQQEIERPLETVGANAIRHDAPPPLRNGEGEQQVAQIAGGYSDEGLILLHLAEHPA